MKTTTIVKIALSILFLICLADMPYGYFQFVRFAGMITFAWLAYTEKDKPIYIFWLSSAILINPFIKIALGRTLWNIIDVFWAVILLVSLAMTHNSKQNRTE